MSKKGLLVMSRTRRTDWKASVGLQFLINKLQDEKPVYLDGFGSTYILKIEKNTYLINHSYYSQNGEPTTISLDELRWFFRKEEILFKDIAASIKGSKNTGVSKLSKLDSYEEYVQYKYELEEFTRNYKSDVIVDKHSKVVINKDVMEALLLAKREILRMLPSLKLLSPVVQLLGSGLVIMYSSNVKPLYRFMRGRYLCHIC